MDHYEFIKRAEELMDQYVDEARTKELEKIRKANKIRKKHFTEASKDLSWEEKKLINIFYKNCPSGYTVDHIIPLCKGGKHCLSNLQYLTPKENYSKGSKLNWDKNK